MFRKRRQPAFGQKEATDKVTDPATLEAIGRFDQFAESAVDHIVVTDSDGVVLYANPAAAALTGYSRPELVGSKASLWGGQMDKAFYEEMWQTIKVDMKAFLGTVVNKRKDGTTYDAQLHISPILNEKGELLYFVGIERDITHLTQLNRTKTEFVSLASHNLKTPLSGVRWFSEMLVKGDVGELNDQQRDYLNEIIEASIRMGALVDNLLSISRIELGVNKFKEEEIRFPTVISEMIKHEFEQKRSEEDVALEVKVGDECVVHGDVELVSNVLRNILSNAVKYSHPKGVVTVIGQIQEASSSFQDHSFPTRHVVIIVADQGIGIPIPEQNEVFRHFFRASNTFETGTKGAGLGLYLTAVIMQRIGGMVWFDSDHNGTTFYLAFPGHIIHTKQSFSNSYFEQGEK